MLSNKTILVTGASSGIGQKTVEVFSLENATVILTARNEDKLGEIHSKLKNAQDHQIIPADLAKQEDIFALVDKSPILNGLVLNAGIVKTMPLRYIKSDNIDSIFEINVKSIILLINRLIKKKKLRTGASICIVSSISSIKPTPGNSVYAASKGALNSFTKAIALELAGQKIRVNAVLPGFVKSNMTSNLIDETQSSRHLDNYPLGRYGETQDIANLILFLLSDKSSWITGNLINIDGGFALK